MTIPYRVQTYFQPSKDIVSYQYHRFMPIASCPPLRDIHIFQPVSVLMTLNPGLGKAYSQTDRPSDIIGIVPFMEEIGWPRQFTKVL
jgi:hypothetical protein